MSESNIKQRPSREPSKLWSEGSYYFWSAESFLGSFWEPLYLGIPRETISQEIHAHWKDTVISKSVLHANLPKGKHWTLKGILMKEKKKQKQKQKPIALLCLWLLRYFHPVLVPHVGDSERTLHLFSQAMTHTHTHTHTHAHTYTCTHIHTHTYTIKLEPALLS